MIVAVGVTVMFTIGALILCYQLLTEDYRG